MIEHHYAARADSNSIAHQIAQQNTNKRKLALIRVANRGLSLATIMGNLEVIDNQNNKDNKFNRVDILVRLDNNEIVLVEIQVDSEPDYLCRMLFGTAKVIIEHIHIGDEYINIKKVYSVNILYFDLGHGDDYIYYGTTNFIGTHTNNKLELSDKQQQLYKKDNIQHIYPEYYLIKVNQFNDIAKDTLDEWIYFLKNETIKDSFKAKGLAE